MGLLLLSAPPISRGDSEIVVAIRYLQAKGTSHSHLYLYREDGKLLRQLTNDNSGQDVDPIFAADGETIVFTREKPNDAREVWSIDPRATKLKKLDAAPDWYSATKSSPAFTSGDEEEAPSSSPTPPQEESASAAASPATTDESVAQREHSSVTALDAVADATDRPPEIIKAPDGSGEIFWRKGKEGEGPEEVLNWVMWFRDSKSGQETQIGRLPGFPSFEPLQITGEQRSTVSFRRATAANVLQLPSRQHEWRHSRGFRFQQAKAHPVIAKLCNPVSSSRGACISHTHRKSICANSRQLEDG